MMVQNGTDPYGERLSRIKSPLISDRDVARLYDHLVSHSDLSPESIIHELESISEKINSWNYPYLSRDLEACRRAPGDPGARRVFPGGHGEAPLHPDARAEELRQVQGTP